MSQSRISFEDYDSFVDKFKPKKTTDDCFTPPEVYAVVLDYVRERWGIEEKDVVRPFWPGGDYEGFEYPDGCCVVDNPPFSKLAKIQTFYIAHNIPFFLFCPSLTCLSSPANVMKTDHIVCDCNITYTNSAVVRTGFVTNLESRYVLEADPDLGDRLNAANNERLKATKKAVGKYEYPDEVLTSARAQWMAARHTPFKVRREDCCFISKLDEQAAQGKAIFGGGLLLSKSAAAERAAAERAAAVRWKLSDRERAMQAILDKQAEGAES